MHFVKDHLTTQRVEDIYPATALQTGLLALSLRQHGSYQACIPLRLPPHINLDRLKRAWETTVEKNAILRTRLIQNACGQVYQAVLLSEKLEWYEATSLDDDSQTSSFWKTEFEGLDCPQFPLLPTAHYTPSITDTLEHTLEHHGSFSPFTLSTIVRLARATVISVYARSDEVVFGATVAGRSVPVPGIEDMTGPTIATVLIRVKIDPFQHINGALEDIRASGVRMIPFEQAGLQLIRTLSPETA
ncbi:hypothetical protein ANO14919_140370 [Xylariales sp. No.14919]|nr:hypothetical protein ANO14919_140370 [Xylariales sp. No.14919]